MKLKRQWQHGDAVLTVEQALESHLYHTLGDSGQLEDLKEQVASLREMVAQIAIKALRDDQILELLPGWEQVE